MAESRFLCRRSFHLQMEVPQLLSLDATKRTVGVLLFCRAVIEHMNRELTRIIHKHGKTLYSLTAGPQAQFTQACQISRVIPVVYLGNRMSRHPAA